MKHFVAVQPFIIIRNSLLFLACAVLLATAFQGIVTQPSASAACSPLPTDRGTATANVNISTSGTYRVWSRILAPTTANNSYFLQIDESLCNVVVGDATIPTNTYVWVDYKSGSTSNKINVTLSGGNHTIKVAGREDNVRLDKILFVSDTSCVPTGDGSNCESSGSTDPDPTPQGSVSFTGVSQGQTVSGSKPIEAKPTNLSSITKVEFYLDNQLIRSETSAPYCFAVSPDPFACSGWDSRKVANGNHTLKAKIFHSGGTTEGSVTFKVQNSNPDPTPEPEDPIDEVVVGDSNSNEKPVVSGKIVLQPSSLDPDTERVEYYINGEKVDGILDTTTLPDGEHEVEVRQYKKDGSVDSSVSSIIVDNHRTIMESLKGLGNTIVDNPVLSGGVAVGAIGLIALGSYLYINRYPVGPSLKQRIQSIWHKNPKPAAQATSVVVPPSAPTAGSPPNGDPTVVHPQDWPPKE